MFAIPKQNSIAAYNSCRFHILASTLTSSKAHRLVLTGAHGEMSTDKSSAELKDRAVNITAEEFPLTQPPSSHKALTQIARQHNQRLTEKTQALVNTGKLPNAHIVDSCLVTRSHSDGYSHVLAEINAPKLYLEGPGPGSLPIHRKAEITSPHGVIQFDYGPVHGKSNWFYDRGEVYSWQKNDRDNQAKVIAVSPPLSEHDEKRLVDWLLSAGKNLWKQRNYCLLGHNCWDYGNFALAAATYMSEHHNMKNFR
jgi:hypothetical protein